MDLSLGKTALFLKVCRSQVRCFLLVYFSSGFYFYFNFGRYFFFTFTVVILMSVEVRSFSIFLPEIHFQADMSTKTLCAVLRNILCVLRIKIFIRVSQYITDIILPGKRNAEVQTLCWAIVLSGKIKCFKMLVIAMVDVS